MKRFLFAWLIVLFCSTLALATPKNIFSGDSITDRNSLSGTNYADWFSQQRGEISVDLAVAGSCAADQMATVYANPPSHANSDASFFMLGANDLGPNSGTGRGYGSGALSLYNSTMRSLIYFAGGITKNARDAAFTYTGTWANNASIGKYSSVAGSTMSVQFTGDVFPLSYLLSDAVSGAWTLAIDGINKGTFSTSPPGTINTWYFHQNYAPGFLWITGNGSGAHTAVITLNSGYFMPEYVGLGYSGVPVNVLTILRMFPPAVAIDAGVAAYNGELVDIVNVFGTAGMNIRLIDSSSFVDPRFDLQSDGIHPWLRTHRKILPLQPY